VQYSQEYFSTFNDKIPQAFHKIPVENSVESVQNLDFQGNFPQGFPQKLWKTLSSLF
jgi:hypothetical protein